MDPRVILICAVLAGGYLGGRAVVHEVKKGVTAIVHVVHKPKTK